MAKPRKTILELWELAHAAPKCGRVVRCHTPVHDENDEQSCEQFVPAPDRELEFGPDGHMRP